MNTSVTPVQRTDADALELRVLSGLHREASCPAQDGAVVGADPDCDIVLADAGVGPRAARLRIGPNGWDIAPQDGAPTGEPRTPFNQALPLGPVWVTVARSGDAWTKLPDAANDGAVPEAGVAQPAEPQAASEARDAASAARSTTSNTGPLPWRAAPAATGSKPDKRAAWPLLLGLAAVVLAVVVAISMAWMLPTAPRQAARENARPTAQDTLPTVNAAIARLGLSDRLRAELLPDGSVQVSGWVRNNAEQDALSAALTQIWPMPAMRVSVAQTIAATAADVLRSFPVKYAARYDGNGRLTVRGIAPDAKERGAAIAALNAQLPGITILGNDVMLAPDVLDDLAGRITAAGIASVGLTWKDNQLQASTSALTDDQVDTLRGVVEQFNATHFGVAVLGKPSVTDMPFADSVPFGIRMVVSGPQPFIVLDNGNKLLVGGTYKRYRLIAVEPTRLVFDGPRPAIVLR
ncbi:MAG: type III secretion system inner membrane ring subunit SctD [Bordetella sp.]|uniref:type III secretion system inner membrane ring subunit SctD n=1 Tax=Bordetella sp. TaxID=28081 RepID=UPI003F7BCA5B